MEKLFVTLLYGNQQTKDLAMPSNVPSQFLAEDLARVIGNKVAPGEVCLLEVLSGDEAKIISPARTLEDARVLNGSYFRIKMEATIAGYNAYLVHPKGVRFVLKKPMIEIGRPGGKEGAPVDIDLSPLDERKVVSKRHAILRLQNNAFVLIDANSRNGTWVNGQKLNQGQSVILNTGDKISFGPPGQGAELTFVNE